MPDFSHSLALSQHQQQALIRPDFPKEWNAEDFEMDQELDDLDLMALFQSLFAGYELGSFAEALNQLEDGLPVPQVFEWQLRSPSDVFDRKGLPADDQRTIIAFQQIITLERKSKKYFAAIQELFQRQPDMGLAISILEYLARWYPDQLEAWSLKQLEQYPDWHVLRFLSATYLLLSSRSATIPDSIQQAYQTLMPPQQELHDFFPAQTVSALTALLFYQAQALWLICCQRPHLKRALYAINLCLEIEAELAAGLDSTAPSQLSETLVKLWIDKVETAHEEQAMTDFASTLRKKNAPETEF